MGKPVTVDSEDLEALLFAAGGIAVIERAIDGYRTDMLVQQVKPRLTAAHARASAAWRQQTREVDPAASEPPTDEEIRQLNAMFPARVGDPSSPDDEDLMRPAVIEWSDMPAVRSLRLKGLIEFGNRFIAWPGEGQTPDFRPGFPTYPCRLTAKGEGVVEPAAQHAAIEPRPWPAPKGGAEPRGIDDFTAEIPDSLVRGVGSRVELADGSVAVTVHLTISERVVERFVQGEAKLGIAAKWIAKKICDGQEAVMPARMSATRTDDGKIEAHLRFRYWDRRGEWRYE